MKKYLQWIPGVMCLSLVVLLAWQLKQYTGYSAALLALAMGWLVGLLFGNNNWLKAGVNWSECHGLSVAVALLGLKLNFQLLFQIDVNSIFLVVAGLLFTFSITLLIAKWLLISNSTACLLASGQGVCGSAAIMGSQKIIQAPTAQVALIVGLVNVLGVIGVIVTTAIAHKIFALDSIESGHLIGNSLQSMGHVVAAGFSVNESTGQMAVLIKMCRILMLIPILLILSLAFRGSKEQQPKVFAWAQLIPLFVIFFLVFSVINTMQWLPENWILLLSQIGDFLMLVALAGIGFNLNFSQLKGLGSRILWLGLVVFVLQVAFNTAWIYYLF